MENQEARKSPVIHKIGAVVMIITALALLVQLVLILTLPDNARLELIKGSAKMEREQASYSPMERALTDEELDQTITEQKATLIEKSKESIKTMVFMKPLFALLLLITAYGLLRNMRSPTRVLAILLTIFLLIAGFTLFNGFSYESKMYKYMSEPSALLKVMFFVDMATVLLIPLSFIFNLIASIKPPAAPPVTGTPA